MYMAIIAVDMSVLKYPVHQYVPGDGWGAARVPLINSKSTFQFVQDLMKLQYSGFFLLTFLLTKDRSGIWDCIFCTVYVYSVTRSHGGFPKTFFFCGFYVRVFPKKLNPFFLNPFFKLNTENG